MKRGEENVTPKDELETRLETGTEVVWWEVID